MFIWFTYQLKILFVVYVNKFCNYSRLVKKNPVRDMNGLAYLLKKKGMNGLKSKLV